MNALTFSIAQLLHTVINAYIWIIIISAVLSFVRPDPYNQIVQAIYKLTEPVYAYFRKNMPFLVVSGIDLTPLMLILGLQFIDTLMMRSLLG
ncbi:Integral membrane protein YggT, involved in response to extracytoplasmic stress (osmotic shock) [hydrothermal vent metagenome]|uniref:Integral membrane protein YggT, involved in response to extracytoplasmic stress (Osmotic shock) n=1 Tax=hydrothermal vent metagenome TaxID=652676 RepID=A0A1W1C8V6_9ZZZZ